MTIATGGFIENAVDGYNKFPRSLSNFLSAIPKSKGFFTFPAPYNTLAVRLTDPSNAPNGVLHTDYAYWSAINAYSNENLIKAFVRPKGASPLVISIDTVSKTLADTSMFPSGDNRNGGVEGWYWSPVDENKIIIAMNDSRIQEYNVVTRETKILFDIAAHTIDGVSGSKHIVAQTHVSRDRNVIAGSVIRVPTDPNASWPKVGAFAYNIATKKFSFFKAIRNQFDEAQIDKSGKFLLIKENVDGLKGEDNRIINLETGEETLLLDEHGAAGHSDMGFECMIASDNYASNANVWKYWNFNDYPLQGKTVIQSNNDWNSNVPSHVSFNHARRDVPIEKQFVVGSGLNKDGIALGNEIVAFSLDGSLRVMPIAPSLSSIAISGANTYDNFSFANTDYRGRCVLWTPMINGRRDAYLVFIPYEKLVGSYDSEPAPAPVPAPTPAPAPAPAPAPVEPVPAPVAPPAPAPAPTPIEEPLTDVKALKRSIRLAQKALSESLAMVEAFEKGRQ